MSKQKVKWFR